MLVMSQFIMLGAADKIQSKIQTQFLPLVNLNSGDDIIKSQKMYTCATLRNAKKERYIELRACLTIGASFIREDKESFPEEMMTAQRFKGY